MYSPAANAVLSGGTGRDVECNVHADGHGGLHECDDDGANQCQPGDTDDHVDKSGGHHLWHGLECDAVECNGVGVGDDSLQPGSGTVLSAGASQALQVTFTPTDATDYTTATPTVTITVNQATPTIAWATPAAITYGTALSATQLNATGSVAGTPAYSPVQGLCSAPVPARRCRLLSRRRIRRTTRRRRPRCPSMSIRRRRRSRGQPRRPSLMARP